MDISSEISSLVNKIRSQAKKEKIIFVAGNFTVLHLGHLRLFDYAKSLQGYLVVGVFAGENSTEFQERLKYLNQNINIDMVITLPADYPQFIDQLAPDYILRGSKQNPWIKIEQQNQRKHKKKYIIVPGNIEVQWQKNDLGNVLQNIEHDSQYCLRHNISKQNLIEYINKIQQTRVMVIGEIILDEYSDCETIGLSNEDATIAIKLNETSYFFGGSAIIAQHAMELGQGATLISLLSTDNFGEMIKKHLDDNNIVGFLFQDSTRKTIQKKRFRVANRTVLRVQDFHKHDLIDEIKESIITFLEQNIDSVDIILCADFGYGMLSAELVARIIKIAAEHGKQVVADAQTSSQIGDLSKFKNIQLIAPTELEARQAIPHSSQFSLLELSNQLYQITNNQYIVVTLAERGVFIHLDADHYPNIAIRTDQIMALNKNPKDVSGAGDLFLLTTAMALHQGADIFLASYLGSMAAAIHVSSKGNTPLKTADLMALANKL